MKKALISSLFLVSLTIFVFSMEPDPDVGLFDRELIDPCQIFYSCPSTEPCTIFVQGEQRSCAGWGFLCYVVFTYCHDPEEAATAAMTCSILCGP